MTRTPASRLHFEPSRLLPWPDAEAQELTEGVRRRPGPEPVEPSMDDVIATMFEDYLGEADWKTKENANTSRSVNGLNNYVREAFTKRYWLTRVYPEKIASAHTAGDFHLHDLGFLGAYCAGWDLRQLLTDGFGGVPGKVCARPAKHLRSFLGQVVNFTCTAAGETAGAQAWSGIDTYCAPLVREDGLTDRELKQVLQEFVYNLNVPTRVGFQCPFSNLTFDLTVPKTMRDQAVILGGETRDQTYKDYQPEMDRFNRAFGEVMLEGDADGRVFTFPIPTVNITPSFDWDSVGAKAFLELACKYGIPYFANYVTSDLSPDDALSMCCRLRLNKKELRKRGGGLFGSNPLTGSIGVVTLNLPRLGYRCATESELLAELDRLSELALESLQIKRDAVERWTDDGLYPYSAHTLRHTKARFGAYWHNHFGTLGLVGMHEMLLNLLGEDSEGIASPQGQALAVRILDRLRDRLSEEQERTGQVYNLEATPAEGTAHRLARMDRAAYPDIITAGGEDEPYYTNSTQLPVGHTDDIFDLLDHQDALQPMYTGGTVQHLYLGQRVDDPKAAASLIRTVFERYRLPYLSLTPTFSISPTHGYLPGEHEHCPHSGERCEVWSRVTGYLRPVSSYNPGKKREYAERKRMRVPV